jgi:hypothetical protein
VAKTCISFVDFRPLLTDPRVIVLPVRVRRIPRFSEHHPVTLERLYNKQNACHDTLLGVTEFRSGSDEMISIQFIDE